MENVLIATLGESPVVVTAMYDLLTKDERKHLPVEIDRLVVLYPRGGMVQDACYLVKKAMENKPCVVELQDVSIEDTNTTRDCMIFLQQLYQRLTIQQNNGDVVFLSLAGGRKSMSALMAWVIPYFSCIAGLYHVIDKNEQDFFTVEQLILEMTDERRQRAMHPELSHLDLVDIPLESTTREGDEWLNRLLSMTDEELDELQEKNAQRAEALQFGRTIAQGVIILNVMFTAYAAEQFRKMSKQDVTHARSFEICFDDMRSAPDVRKHSHHSESGKGPQSRRLVFHYFKRNRTPERPMFYTLPKDIKSVPDSEVNDVVVCSLEIEREGDYRSIAEILATPDLSLEPVVTLDALPSVKYRKDVESVLIVPLGTSPMVATQLYTLLKRQDETIGEVVLVYPSKQEIMNGAQIVKQALKEEDGMPCRLARIPGLQDIKSKTDCETYQSALEREIDRVRDEHPHAQLLLALSGGRKGMAALAMFVAIRKRIPYLFHTLISDDALEQRIVKETSIRALSKPGLDKKLRNDRLFLRAYVENDQQLAANFTLFTVPVLLPSDGMSF